MLNVVSLEKARELLRNELARTEGGAGREPEAVPPAAACGRVLARPVTAPVDVPAFDRSQVDGLAVRAEDTFGASEALPAILLWKGEIAMGQVADRPLQPGQCQGIATGGMLPPGADAVVMIEDVEQLDATTRLVTRRVAPGSHVTRRGDDVRAGQLVLAAGRRLLAPEIGAAAALGLSYLPVWPSLKVVILSTGDELVAADAFRSPAEAPPGTVFDVNGPMLAAAVQAEGHCPLAGGIIRDQQDQLAAALDRALTEADVVLISGGSSAGARDYVAETIQAAGAPGLLLHGLAVKPGKPTVAGICRGKLVIGLPGHPVAAWFMFQELVRPLLSGISGQPLRPTLTVPARTTCRIPSNHGREEFVLVRLRPATPDLATPDLATPQAVITAAAAAAGPGTAGPVWLAEPLATRSGLITPLSCCDGYLRIERDLEGLEAFSLTEVTLIGEWRKEAILCNRLI